MKFHNLNIKSIQKITSEAVEITFTIPESLRKNFKFLAGQYLTIAPVIEGTAHRRAYSICSAISTDTISILVKKVEGGKVSTYVNEQLVPNTKLMVAEPNGSFALDHSSLEERSHIIFGYRTYLNNNL